jgi:hypothetical protein
MGTCTQQDLLKAPEWGDFYKFQQGDPFLAKEISQGVWDVLGLRAVVIYRSFCQ